MDQRVRNLLIIVPFLLFTGLMLYSNLVWTKKGGVLENAILDTENPYYKMDRYVRGISKMHEPIRIVLKLSRGNGSGEIKVLHQKLSKELPELGLLSEENFPCHGSQSCKESFRFAHQGEEYSTFLLYPSVEMEETTAFRKVTSFLEEREVAEWEWFLKSDIHPANKNVLVGGWIIGRGVIDGALNADVIKTITIGLALTTILLFLGTGSLGEALLASLGVVFLSIIWVRGEIGLLDHFGFDVRERVYVLLVYTNCIVQGVSFTLHLLMSKGGKTRDWREVAKKVLPLIAITTIISFFGFITLYSFQVLAIRELGILSALGVLNLFALAIVLLPALLSLFGLESKERRATVLWSFYGKIARGCHGALSFVRPEFQGVIATIVVFSAIITAGILFTNGSVVVESRPLEYIKGTIIEKTADLTRDAKVGFDSLEVLVEMKNGENVYDPALLKEGLALVNRLGKLEGVNRVFSVLPLVKVLSFLKEGDAEGIKEILNDDVGKLDVIRDQLFSKTGYRVSVVFGARTSSEMRKAREMVEQIASDYPALKVSLFGTVAMYPSVDEYIVVGKPLNVITSESLVIILCVAWVFWLNRSLGGNRKVSPLVTSVAMTVPFLFSSSVIVVVMAWTKVPLDVVTAAIGAIALNASVDFSIYFEETFQREISYGSTYEKALKNALEKEGPVIIADAVLNIVCFLPLVFSSFVPVARLGWMMALMLSVACIATLLLMPPLLRFGTKPLRT